MLSFFKRSKVKKLARIYSHNLINKFGKKEYYSYAELSSLVKDQGTLSRNDKIALFAMFSKRKDFEVFLKETSRFKSTSEIRSKYHKTLFKSSPSEAYGSWNRFHDYNNEIFNALKNLGSNFSSAKSDTTTNGFSTHNYDSGGYD